MSETRKKRGRPARAIHPVYVRLPAEWYAKLAERAQRDSRTPTAMATLMLMRALDGKEGKA